MDFGNMDGAIGSPDASGPLAFAPTAMAVDPPQARDPADRGTCGESLDGGNFANNLKLHPSSVSISGHTVNGRGLTLLDEARLLEGASAEDSPHATRAASRSSWSPTI
jgi:hypothetical protein